MKLTEELNRVLTEEGKNGIEFKNMDIAEIEAFEEFEKVENIGVIDQEVNLVDMDSLTLATDGTAKNIIRWNTQTFSFPGEIKFEARKMFLKNAFKMDGLYFVRAIKIE